MQIPLTEEACPTCLSYMLWQFYSFPAKTGLEGKMFQGRPILCNLSSARDWRGHCFARLELHRAGATQVRRVHV
eukprot:1159928-Pelagomonas_calceolata.AAC.18